MTASSTGGSSGIAAMAAEIPARTASPSDGPAEELEPIVCTMRAVATSRMIGRGGRVRAGGATGPDGGTQEPGDRELRRCPVATTTPSPCPPDGAGAGVGHGVGRRAVPSAGIGSGRRLPGRTRPSGRCDRTASPMDRTTRSRPARCRPHGGRRGRPERALGRATLATSPSRRTAAGGAAAVRSSSRARSPRYAVTTSAPTIGTSPRSTSSPSRTSPRSTARAPATASRTTKGSVAASIRDARINGREVDRARSVHESPAAAPPRPSRGRLSGRP